MKKCKVQLVSELETNIEVKAIAFVPKEKKEIQAIRQKETRQKIN